MGKIGDLFCHSATGRELKGKDNEAVFDQAVDAAKRLSDGGLMLVNLVDFDALYGHRHDVAGYAAALETFDARLPEFLCELADDDIAIITGDHGCDPTWAGSDHTRECVPLLAFGPGFKAASLGRLNSFADMGASIAAHLRPPRISEAFGRSFLW